MTAHNIWRKIKGIYAEQNTVYRICIHEKMLTLRLGVRADAQPLMQDMARIHTQLCADDVEIDDMLYKLALLLNLTTRFKNLLVALKTNIGNILIEELQARIFRNEESRYPTVPSKCTTASRCTEEGKRLLLL